MERRSFLKTGLGLAAGAVGANFLFKNKAEANALVRSGPHAPIAHEWLEKYNDFPFMAGQWVEINGSTYAEPGEIGAIVVLHPNPRLWVDERGVKQVVVLLARSTKDQRSEYSIEPLDNLTPTYEPHLPMMDLAMLRCSILGMVERDHAGKSGF